MPRFLRPAHLVPSGDSVWLVDESWPVAAALDRGGTPAVVSWEPSATSSEAARVAVADGVGIVVQDGAQAAWVRRPGSTVQPVPPGLRLSAADPEVAWFAEMTVVYPADPQAGASGSHPAPLSGGQIIAIRHDGLRSVVAAPAPVKSLHLEGVDVVVTLAQRPVAHQTSPTSWRYEYPTVQVRVDRHRLLDEGLDGATPLPADAGARPRLAAGRWWWLETDPQTIRAYGVHAGGLLWWAGAPEGGNRIDRRVIAVGHDPTTAQEVLRVDLGQGLVSAARTVGDELWLAVARRRFLPYAPRDRGVDVLAVTAQARVRTVYRADSIDITASAPPLLRPTDQQIDEHVEAVRSLFDSLDRFWQHPDGTTGPLSDGLTEPAVAVEGSWPHTRLIVTVRHSRRPGLLLRRTLTLFDDTGQPIHHNNAEVHLMEDLDTGYLAPAEEAVAGVLDT